MRKFMVLSVLSFVMASKLLAQDTLKHNMVPARVIEGDTLPYVDLKTVVLFPQTDIRTVTDLMAYQRLVFNIRKVYPYAKLAAEKLKEYEHTLDSIPTERGRRRFIKAAEKELQDKFGDQIKELNFTQGKLLIKLVYRETGSSTFALVKELRGGFNAFVYQSVARIFGYNLRSEYDPEGDDKAIEQIVLMINSGNL